LRGGGGGFGGGGPGALDEDGPLLGDGEFLIERGRAFAGGDADGDGTVFVLDAAASAPMIRP
jgi:hypothetical protein